MTEVLTALEALPASQDVPEDPMGPDAMWCVPVFSCVMHFSTLL